MSGTLLLEEYRPLFKDEKSFENFVLAFKQATDKGIAVVMSGDKLIGSVLSTGCTKKVLADRMIESIAKKPSLIDELTKSLGEDIVD